MTIKEFNLLEIDVYDGDKKIYTGMCEDAPEELKKKQIKILRNESKKIIFKLTEQKKYCFKNKNQIL